MDNKNLTVIKQQISRAESAAQELVIKTDQDLVKASDYLAKVKQVAKLITDEKDKQLSPAMETVRAIRAFWAPWEEKWKWAEALVKTKMLEFRQKQIAKVEKKEERIADQVDSGKISFEEGQEKLLKVEPPKSTIEAPKSAITYRKVKEVVIEDALKLPRKYLEPNLQLIKADALAGVEIPGVRITEREVIASYGK